MICVRDADEGGDVVDVAGGGIEEGLARVHGGNRRACESRVNGKSVGASDLKERWKGEKKKEEDRRGKWGRGEEGKKSEEGRRRKEVLQRQ